MVAMLLHLIEHLGGKEIGILALDFHAAALSLLAIFWSLPLCRLIFRRFTGSPDTTWVSLWQCPKCGQYNRRASLDCQHCLGLRQMPWWERWKPVRLIDWSVRN